MGTENPAGLELIKKELDDISISQLQQRVMDVLNDFTPTQDGGGGNPVLRWNSSAGDQTILASFKDLVERMAELTHRDITWRPAKNAKSLPWDMDPKVKMKQRSCSNIDESKGDTPGGRRRSSRKANVGLLPDISTYIIFDKAHSSDASVLGAEISRRLDRAICLGGDPDSHDKVLLSSAVVLVLTKDLLVTPSCIAELYAACKSGLPIIS
eukprot:5545392-Prymnesium_polylepis.1